MPVIRYSPEEIACIGNQIYQRKIRGKVSSQHKGEALAVRLRVCQATSKPGWCSVSRTGCRRNGCGISTRLSGRMQMAPQTEIWHWLQARLRP
jgi:hypothetical protein